ncbi:hypothetical protein R8Z50_22885 [Longispora sp. K20-0274]|uniref:hypothetical protein n=1 Tax=Longispora sp. K20-0274 TaxID=3088255 RepID=UPI00399A6CB0
MTLQHIMLARLCRAAGYDIDLDMHAIATAIDTRLVLAFLKTAHTLAGAQLAAAWASSAVGSTHDMIATLESGELDDEATHLSNAVAARKHTHDDLQRCQAAFTVACDNLFKYGELLLIRHPAPLEAGQ